MNKDELIAEQQRLQQELHDIDADLQKVRRTSTRYHLEQDRDKIRDRLLRVVDLLRDRGVTVNDYSVRTGNVTGQGIAIGAGAQAQQQTSTPPPPATPAPPTLPPTRSITIPGTNVTMEFVLVPAGAFLMGISDDDPDADHGEKPQHTVTLPAYYIGKYPVTNAQFAPFVNGDGYRNPRYWTAAGWEWKARKQRTQPYNWRDRKWNGAAQPVVGITWYEAYAYAAWLAAQVNEVMRLPSEAEWEKAARGTDGRRYPWGNHPPDATLLNYNQHVCTTTPVGTYPGSASPYGAHDMAGNVLEWTRTRWGYRYPYDAGDGREDDAGDAGRVVRGGSWYHDGTYVQCGARHRLVANGGLPLNGVRVLLAPRV